MNSSRRRIYGDDHEAFRASVKRFIAAEVIPDLDAWRCANGMPRSVIATAGDAGFLGTAVPEEFGGGGTRDFGFLSVLIEEAIAAGATGLALLSALQAGVTIPFLLEHGTTTQKRDWLPGLSSGQSIGVPSPAALSSVAAGRIADLVLVCDDSDGVMLIPLDQRGITVTPIEGNLGARDAALADITLDGTGRTETLPGAAAIARDLDMWFAVLALACVRTALAHADDYVHARKVFGRPLAEFENTRLRLAELSAQLRALTVFVDSCLEARNAHALDAEDAATARLTADGLCDRAVDQALQFHGGYGYMREYPISHAFADARFLRLTATAFSDPREALAAGAGR